MVNNYPTVFCPCGRPAHIHHACHITYEVLQNKLTEAETALKEMTARHGLLGVALDDLHANNVHKDAYDGVREDLLIWKKRTLEAEARLSGQQKELDEARAQVAMLRDAGKQLLDQVYYECSNDGPQLMDTALSASSSQWLADKIAEAKREEQEAESNRWANRLNWIHIEHDVDGSGCESGDALDVIEGEIKQAIGKYQEHSELLFGLLNLMDNESGEGKWKVTLEYDNYQDGAVIRNGDEVIIGECYTFNGAENAERPEDVPNAQFVIAIGKAVRRMAKEK